MSQSLSPPLPLPSLPPNPNPNPNPPIQLPQPQPTPHPNKKKPSTLRTRLSRLCKSNRLDLARRLFDSLPSPPPPPTLLWNTLLIGYVSNSRPLEALRFFSLMPPSLPPDHYTFSSALSACARIGRLDLGRALHCRILRTCLPSPPANPVLNNSLLSMYALCSPSSPAARILFDKMPKRTVVSYNTLVAWHVRQCRPHAALSLFITMLSRGVSPSAVSFVGVLPAAVEKTHADSLYAMLSKFGAEYVRHAFVVSSAIRMFSGVLDVESARKVFRLAEEKNAEVWNTMIGGYVQNGRYEEAAELFVEMLECDEVFADSVSFLGALTAASQLQDFALGQQIHGFLMKESSGVLSVSVGNALVVMYSRCGCVQLAFDLFDQMPVRDVVTWNTMVSAFVQNDLNLEGLLLVYEMQKQGFVVDSVTVTALLSAASNLGSLRIGRETHGFLIRHEICCEGMDSYLIDMYSKSGRVEIAQRLFDRNRSSEKDRVTWNAMIAGYVQNGRTEEAMALFRKMVSNEDRVLNSVTISSILPACDPVGGIQAGRQIHGYAVRRCLDKNVFVGTALVDMYSRCGEIVPAEKVFDAMEERNSVTYTTMLSGFGQHGLGERALSLFRSMQNRGLKPDAITFVALLSACSYSGLVDEGLALYGSMTLYEISPTSEHYCCVVDLLGRAGRVEEAYEFVRGLGDGGNTVGVWGSLLSACRVHQKFELGKLVSERLFEIADGGASGYRVLLSNVYAADGKWESVHRIRKDMRERGLRKEPGWSSIGIGEASHKFMSRDQTHPESDRVYAALEDLVSEMRLNRTSLDTSLVHELPFTFD